MPEKQKPVEVHAQQGGLDKCKTKDTANALQPLDKQKNSFEPKQTIETKTNCF